MYSKEGTSDSTGTLVDGSADTSQTRVFDGDISLAHGTSRRDCGSTGSAMITMADWRGDRRRMKEETTGVALETDCTVEDR